MESLILKKIDYLVDLADRFEASAQPSELDMGYHKKSITEYDVELYSELESSTKSLVIKLYGDSHPYYKKLEERLTNLMVLKKPKEY